jgi:hypothetical protein
MGGSHRGWVRLHGAISSVAAAVVAGLTLAACGGGGGSATGTSSAGRNAVLVVAPNPSGPFVNTFSPFLPTAGGPAAGWTA